MSAAVSRAPLGRVTAVHLASLALAGFVTFGILPWALSVATLAAAFSWLAGLAPWWIAINALFVPALSFALSFDVSPLWALAVFVGLVLVYGGIWKSRVPLFFSSGAAVDALSKLLPAEAVRFLDVGCGDGRVLARLASSRPDSVFEGVEQALVPWLTAKLRERFGRGQCAVRRADLWALDLGGYDVVYAYLSPAVMPELWAKARREMRAGAMLVSAFAVPGAHPDESIEVDDALATQLHVWRMKAGVR